MISDIHFARYCTIQSNARDMSKDVYGISLALPITPPKNLRYAVLKLTFADLPH